MTELETIYNQLFEKYGEYESNGESWLSYSDKGTNHSYIPYYEKFFKHKKSQVDLLEIGVMTGGSMHVWQNYFDSYNLVGVDLNSGWHDQKTFTSDLDQDKNLVMHWNVDSRKPLASLVLGTQMFDFIIDDGDHSVLAQQDTFVNFYRHVRPGGTYFIEDVIGATQQATLLKWLQGLLQGHDHSIDIHEGIKNGRQDDRIIAITRGLL